jgi:putative transcriptional regulator
MTKAGERLLQAAREARSIARGEAAPGTFRLHIPPEIDVKKIRARKGLTQTEFAARYGLNIGRLRDWEQNRSKPDSAARAYLMVIEKEPEAVERALSGVMQGSQPQVKQLAG